ncbi:MAG: hypothetical protein K0B85_05575 [Coriobacteriia bacterium]|nr:hypothetical protein [Coriobacteriia bacterium]
MGQTLVAVGAVVIVVGAALIARALWSRPSRTMTREQQEWANAEAAHQERIAAAKTALDEVVREHDRAVREAELALKHARTLGQERLVEHGDVEVFKHRVRIGEKSFPYDGGPIQASVSVTDPIGSATGTTAPGRATLVVSATRGDAVVRFPSEDAETARWLAGMIESASRTWADAAAHSEEGQKAASTALQAVKATRNEAVAAAEAALKQARADTSAVDSARSKLSVGYCPSCATNVALDKNNACPGGHSSGIRKFDHSCSKPVMAAFPARRGKVMPIVAAVLGVALVVAGLAMGTPEEREAVRQPAEAGTSTPAVSPSDTEGPDAGDEAPEVVDGAEPDGVPDTKKPPAAPDTREAEQAYRVAVIELNTEIAERLDELTGHLIAARYGDAQWLSDTRATLSGMRDTAAKARQVSVPPMYDQVHEAWMEGIESYDWAAQNYAIAIEGPDYSLMERCTARLEDASSSLRRATVLLQEMEP